MARLHVFSALSAFFVAELAKNAAETRAYRLRRLATAGLIAASAWLPRNVVGSPFRLSAPAPAGAASSNASYEWQSVELPTMLSERLDDIAVVSATEWWAPGNLDMLHYSDGRLGAVPIPWGSSIYAMDMVSSTDGWAVGSYGRILRYSGGAWIKAASPTATDLRDVAMVSAADGWAVGDYGTILHYSGGSWSAATSPTTSHLFGLAMVSAKDGWAVAGDGTILHYQDGSWSAATSPTSEGLTAISMVSASDGWAVGTYGTIAQYTGGSWRLASSPTVGHINAVDMVSSAEGWAVGVWDILHYQNGSWAAAPSPLTDCSDEALSGLAMLSITAGWAVGSCARVFHYAAIRGEPGLAQVYLPAVPR